MRTYYSFLCLLFQVNSVVGFTYIGCDPALYLLLFLKPITSLKCVAKQGQHKDLTYLSWVLKCFAILKPLCSIAFIVLFTFICDITLYCIECIHLKQWLITLHKALSCMLNLWSIWISYVWLCTATCHLQSFSVEHED